MIKRATAVIMLTWLVGFVWFTLSLPRSVHDTKTESVVVLTGGEGRIERGLAILNQGLAAHMLISGVSRDVRLNELAAEYHIAPHVLNCCIDIDRRAIDTRSNAVEASNWVRKNHFRSVRVITNNWHMTRAGFEIARQMPPDVLIVRDAVETTPSMLLMLVEYNKYLWRRIAAPFEKG